MGPKLYFLDAHMLDPYDQHDLDAMGTRSYEYLLKSYAQALGKHPAAMKRHNNNWSPALHVILGSLAWFLVVFLYF